MPIIAAAPYEGCEPYAFFSCCRSELEQFSPLLRQLARSGLRIWFDECVNPGEDRTDLIAERLEQASVFISAITPAFVKSLSCRNELAYAVSGNKPHVSLLMEQFDLPPGIRLQLSSANYLRRFDKSEEAFLEQILTAPALADCISDLTAPFPEGKPLRALLLRAGSAAAASFPLGSVVIGRSFETSDLPIPENPRISRNHLRLYRLGDEVMAEDLDSSYGTAVNGVPLSGPPGVSVPEQCELRMADEPFLLIYGELLASIISDRKLAYLQCDSTHETRLVSPDGMPLDRRHPWRDAVLTDKRISRWSQAEIVSHRDTDGSRCFFLQDLGSPNGTFLNGERLPPDKEAKLRDGDHISVVDTAFTFRIFVFPSTEPTVVSSRTNPHQKEVIKWD